MEYTQSDVDKILEASEKATSGPWEAGEGELDGGYLGVFVKGSVMTSPICRVSPIKAVNEEDVCNSYLLAGAPILAEEVKRLRAKMELLKKLRDDIDDAFLDDGWWYVDKIDEILD